MTSQKSEGEMVLYVVVSDYGYEGMGVPKIVTSDIAKAKAVVQFCKDDGITVPDIYEYIDGADYSDKDPEIYKEDTTHADK